MEDVLAADLEARRLAAEEVTRTAEKRMAAPSMQAANT